MHNYQRESNRQLNCCKNCVPSHLCIIPDAYCLNLNHYWFFCLALSEFESLELRSALPVFGFFESIFLLPSPGYETGFVSSLCLFFNVAITSVLV